MSMYLRIGQVDQKRFVKCSVPTTTASYNTQVGGNRQRFERLQKWI